MLLWPYLEAHLLRGGTPMPLLEERPYECWSYDFRNDQINIHIANLYQPRSRQPPRQRQHADTRIGGRHGGGGQCYGVLESISR